MKECKVRKRLYVGAFNYAGEVITVYKRAHTENTAFQLMVLELAKYKGLSAWAIRQYFNGEKPNYEIKEDKGDG
uniref:Uncharacterized protein n=1 Tax=viral metagenome TaxID=1070528 RepID=A0A6M3JD15_9ZZZZ